MTFVQTRRFMVVMALSLVFLLLYSTVVNAQYIENNVNNSPSEIKITNLTSSHSFKDIDLNTEAGRALQKLVDLQVLHGYPDSTIKPNDILTREQAAKILTLLTLKEPNLELYSNSFKDVAKNGWASPYISFSYEYGYIKGTPDNLFLGQNELTRGQMAVILANFLGYYNSYDRLNTFTDVPQNAYYYDAVYALVENEITQGTSPTTFSPNAPVTRAQIAIFFDRSGLLDELLFLQDGIDWSSLPKDWVNGNHYDIYDIFNGYLNDYFGAYGDNDESIMINYGVIGTEWENESLTISNILNGTIIPIEHDFYNYYTEEYTRFLVYVQIDNNEIIRYRIETDEDILENFTQSHGLLELDDYINSWAKANHTSRDSIYLFSLDEDIRYYASLFNSNMPHFVFPDNTSFYIALIDYYESIGEIIKITPITKEDGRYDISFEVAKPTYQVVVENKNNRQTEQVLIDQNVIFNYTTDGKFLYFDIFADKDTNKTLKNGDVITINLYDIVDLYDEEGNYIGYEYHDDFITFFFENGNFEILSEYSSITSHELEDEADHYYENDDEGE